MESLIKLEKIFNKIQNDEPYAHFEIMFTRRTGFMAWICSRCIDDDPNRTIYARGQGDSIESACSDAVAYYHKKSVSRDRQITSQYTGNRLATRV